jgi:hypothetical protein
MAIRNDPVPPARAVALDESETYHCVCADAHSAVRNAAPGSKLIERHRPIRELLEESNRASGEEVL